jgi:GT2 family glycosyltransferase
MFTKVQTLLYKTETHYLEKFLDCISASVLPADDHLYLNIGDCSPTRLIDEHATDYWSTELLKFGIEFNYTFFGENLGFAKGHNALFNETPAGDRLLILNPDAILPFHLIARLNAFADTCVDFGIADVRQIPLEHPKMFNPLTYETEWASGACALVDVHAFQGCGGFDELFFMYSEDVDLSWRIRAAGYRAYYCVDTFLYHDKRITAAGPETSETEYYYGILNSMLLRAKYGRADLNKPVVTWLRGSNEPLHDKIAKQYNRMAKRVKVATDKERKVATFTGDGEFTRHRWRY